METQKPDLSTHSNGDESPIASAHGDHHGRVPTHYAPSTGFRLVRLACVIGIFLAVGFFFVQHHKAQAEAELNSESLSASHEQPGVDVIDVQPAPATRLLTLPGETRAWYESTIYGRVSGYVADWKADIGDKVSKGQVLATIDTPDLDDQLAAAQANLKASEAGVKVEESNTDFAKSTYERWKDSPKGVVSEQEREEKHAGYNSSIAKLNAAKARVNLDEADVNRLTALTAFKQVASPFNGVVTARHIDVGNLVTAGSTSNTTSLYTVAQADRIRVFVDVPQRASVAIKVGMPAVITTEEYPDRKFEGKVARTEEAINPVSRTLKVEVDLENTDLALKPGMYVEVAFELKQPSLLQVPSSALLFRSNGPQVAVVNSDGAVEFRDIKIANDQGDVVELASGVTAAEKVAMNLSSQIVQGDHVKINAEEKPKPVMAAALAVK